MHRLIQDHLEEILSFRENGTELDPDHPALQHLASCQECEEMVSEMEEQNALFRALRSMDVDGLDVEKDNAEAGAFAREGMLPEAIAPEPGFYARVMETIESQRPLPSIWELFGDSMAGRRLAAAALAFSMVMGVLLVSGEANVAASPSSHIVTATYPMLPAADFPDEVLTGPMLRHADLRNQAPGRDEVLLSLMSYQGQ